MGVIKFLRDISGLFNWNTDDNPTSELTYMNAVKNWQETEKNLVDTVLWQPTTAYSVGNMVKTPSLPSQYCLVCTTAGTSGANEPTYSSVSVGDSVSDGSVTWMVADDFNSSIKTYNATDVIDISGLSDVTSVSGYFKKVGNHLIICKLIFRVNDDYVDSHWSTIVGRITDFSLVPKILPHSDDTIIIPGYNPYVSADITFGNNGTENYANIGMRISKPGYQLINAPMGIQGMYWI